MFDRRVIAEAIDPQAFDGTLARRFPMGVEDAQEAAMCAAERVAAVLQSRASPEHQAKPGSDPLAAFLAAISEIEAIVESGALASHQAAPCRVRLERILQRLRSG